MVFSTPLTTGAAPVARVAHSATVWEDKLVLFGGGDGTRRFKDLYMLSLGMISVGPVLPVAC